MLRMKIFVGIILSIFSVCSGLRNVHIKFPSAVAIGKDATLQCFYNLEGDKLYSVKWYRGNMEFFRYSPGEFPPIKQFKIRGINVREKDSKDTQVVLEKVTKEISGMYSCEVTADQPSFFTDIKTAELRVVDLPRHDPQITGLKTRYRLDETIKANCTSQGSYPAANLTWYINGIPLEEKYVQRYEPLMYNEDELVSALSTVKLKVVKHLFINGKMKLRCSATMHHLYHKSSEKSIELHKKRHRSSYSWMADDLTTTETFNERWDFPAERPPQAAVELSANVIRSNVNQKKPDVTTQFFCILVVSAQLFIR
ncbi:uncharacterized protein LOC126745611 [Anthonomus grandis grandis]|uniref:uncharacterized protein LOC126745611 n=1 Tax=Anthonomus grandis grandis TaxID=2921223 RepID=UPI0021667867|nr:uncharacterized protein LOC126745611 [Anthonomus grandis grandis]